MARQQRGSVSSVRAGGFVGCVRSVCRDVCSGSNTFVVAVHRVGDANIGGFASCVGSARGAVCNRGWEVVGVYASAVKARRECEQVIAA